MSGCIYIHEKAAQQVPGSPELLLLAHVDLETVKVDGEQRDHGVDRLDAREYGEDLLASFDALVGRVEGRDQAHPKQAG